MKLNIRLPSDDDHGPNPYDSKTPPKALAPAWLSSWGWWFQIIAMGAGLVAVRYYMNGGAL